MRVHKALLGQILFFVAVYVVVTAAFLVIPKILNGLPHFGEPDLVLGSSQSLPLGVWFGMGVLGFTAAKLERHKSS